MLKSISRLYEYPVAVEYISFQKESFYRSTNYLFIYVLFFIVNPFFATLGLFIYSINNRICKSTLYVTAVSGSALLSLINSTKMPENDLTTYYSYFLDAGQLTYIPYLYRLANYTIGPHVYFIKEPLYGTFSYIMYYITGGQPRLFLFIYSMIYYILLCISLIRLCKSIGLTNQITVFCIGLLIYTPYIFTMSEQLIRQDLACAIIFYLMTSRFFCGKKAYFLILAVGLIHSSSLLLLVISLVYFLKNKCSRRNIMFYICFFIALISYQILAQTVLGGLGDGDHLYAINRAATVSDVNKEKLPVYQGIISFMICIIPLFILYIASIRRVILPGVYHLVHLFMAVSLFVIINLNKSLVSERFNFYIWVYFPFSIAIIMAYFRYLKQMRMLLSMLIVGLNVFFIYYLYNGGWTFKCADDILCNTLFHYFFYTIYL